MYFYFCFLIIYIFNIIFAYMEYLYIFITKCIDYPILLW